MALQGSGRTGGIDQAAQGSSTGMGPDRRVHDKDRHPLPWNLLQPPPAQWLLVLLPRFDRSIDTRPAPPKRRTLTQLGETAGMVIQQQRIHQLKLGIPTLY